MARRCMQAIRRECLAPFFAEYEGMSMQEIDEKLRNTHLRETCGYVNNRNTINLYRLIDNSVV